MRGRATHQGGDDPQRQDIEVGTESPTPKSIEASKITAVDVKVSQL